MARLSSSIVAAFMFFAALSNALPTLPTLDSDSVQDGDNVPVPDSPDFLPLKLAHFTHNSIKDEALHGISGGLKEREVILSPLSQETSLERTNENNTVY